MQTKKRFTYIFSFAVFVLTAVMGITYAIMVQQEQKKTDEVALSTARSALTQDKIFRFWATSHGGFYVPITKRTPPNPALKHLPNRDLNIKDKNLTLMNPAYALRQMMSEYTGLYGLKGHITSLQLLNPDNAPDTWERKKLQEMQNGAIVKEKYAFLYQNNREVLRVLEPLHVKEGCLKCHAHQGYKIGDVRGAVTVMLPMRELNEKKESAIFNLSILYILSWSSGLLFLIYFYRKIIQSLSAQENLHNELITKEHFLRTLIDTDSNLIVTTYGRQIHLANQALLDFTTYKTLEDFKKNHHCICEFFIEKENFIGVHVNGKNWIEHIISTPQLSHHVCMKKDEHEYIFSLNVKQMDIVGTAEFIVVFNDITELVHSQKNLALAQQIAKIGHWELDILKNTLHWSDEVYSIFGLKKTLFHPTYETFVNMIHPDDREMVNEAYKASLTDKKEYQVVHRIVLPDTYEEKTVEEKCTHYFDENGTVIRSLGTIQDISERRKLEIQLQEKEEMMIAQSRHAAMGEMISMIAHQWRQPITVISMVANNLLADIEFDDMNPESIKKSATKVLEQSHHLSKTIDDFKNFFRPNKKTEPILVNDVLEENFKIVGKSLENNNIAIEKRYESYTPIDIFSRELLQVFINILKNAKEALMENKIKNPAIVVSTYEDKTYVYIDICDNGKGIDPQIISKIYDPYFSTKDEKVGTGLGLYMTKIIVQKHLNGTINALNYKDGGVCFKISLPKRSEKNE
ncbi:MAG: DUF3365 domain-containing protein [Campylobacterota bacterium]|nr:DUF3365 domain-containing protein [Campylobacterota bacterium]